MCLVLSIRLSEPLTAPTNSFSSEVGALFLTPMRQWFRASNIKFTVSEQVGACACSLLADNADWNDEHWKIRAEGRTRLGQTIEKLGKLCPKGFSLEALWVGEKANQSVRLPLNEMLRIVESDGIGTKTCYDVVV